MDAPAGRLLAAGETFRNPGLADALENEPSMQDFQQLPALGSRRRIGFDPRGHRPGGPVSIAVIQEFDRLNATCNACHMLFRGWRR